MGLADAESASARAKVELAKDALSLVVENFKNPKKFKEEILEDRFASYCIGYKDGQDAVGKLYPNLNLSSIVPRASKEEAAEEGTALAKDDAPTAPGPAPAIEAVPEQDDEEND